MNKKNLPLENEREVATFCKHCNVNPTIEEKVPELSNQDILSYSSCEEAERLSIDSQKASRLCTVSPDSQGEPVPTHLLTSTRFRLALLCWFGFAVLYAQRTNLSIAMVCMTKHVNPHNSSTNSSNDDSLCPVVESTDSDTGFDWSKTLQGAILGSFFYGYFSLQIIGGVMAERLGAKIVVTVGMLPVALLTIVTPLLTKIHYVVLIVSRVFIGMGQAVMYPAVAALWGKWSPPMERTVLVGLSLSGGQFGNAFILPVGGFLCAEAGWESIFYVIGTLGMVFVLLWMTCASSSPNKHKSLSDSEKAYLERTIPGMNSTKKVSTPWNKILTSLPVWSIIIAHSFGNYTYYMNLTQIPTYMKEVLKFNIKSNGVFSMLPYVVFWLSTIAAGFLSDYIASKNVSLIIVRKTFAFFGLVGPACFMLATAYVSCAQRYLAVFTLCCAVGFTGCGFASYMVNHGDLAPELAGTLFGISNTVATLPGFIAPAIVGALTLHGSATEWRNAFYVAAIINVAGAIFYCAFGSASIQPWSTTYVSELTKQEQITDAKTIVRTTKPTEAEIAEAFIKAEEAKKEIEEKQSKRNQMDVQRRMSMIA